VQSYQAITWLRYTSSNTVL